MKRMVKNGDLLDVEPDGTITVAGKPIGGGGGGGDYTAGSNIKISEAKEISLKSDITGINSISFAGDPTPSIGVYGGGVKIKNGSPSFEYSPIYLFRYGFDEGSRRYLSLSFKTDNDINNWLYFDTKGFDKTNYVFITKGGNVPPVPSTDGTYVLKATVSGGAVTYTWVAQ